MPTCAVLPKGELVRFKSTLLARKNILTGNEVVHLNEDEVFSRNDLSSRKTEMFKEEILNDRKRSEIRQIDAALDRIKAKTYGLCRKCNNPINKERLEAVPTTDLCLPCCQKEKPFR
ncbi:MAG: TraR/DksA C4-type zinc finger protein [Candidatus Paceibacterota bacterium]|jgi:RNA polymerase-binding protein DksA